MCSPDADQQLVSLKWSAERGRMTTATAAADSLEEKWSFSGSYAAEAAACRYNATAALVSLEEPWRFSGACSCAPALQQMQPCSLLFTFKLWRTSRYMHSDKFL